MSNGESHTQWKWATTSVVAITIAIASLVALYYKDQGNSAASVSSLEARVSTNLASLDKKIGELLTKIETQDRERIDREEDRRENQRLRDQRIDDRIIALERLVVDRVALLEKLVNEKVGNYKLEGYDHKEIDKRLADIEKRLAEAERRKEDDEQWRSLLHPASLLSAGISNAPASP